MILVTLDSPNEIGVGKVKDVLGIVYGVCVLGKKINSDIGYGLKATMMKDNKKYSMTIEKSIELALSKLQENAERIGADAVVGIKFQTTSMSQHASEMVVYGTAVKLNSSELS